MLTERERRSLDELGYLVLEDFMSAKFRESLRRRCDELLAEEGEQAGAEFKQEPQSQRLANLVNKGEVFERLISTPEVLERVAHVLGPEFKLGSLNFRAASPHSDWVQPLHCDMGALPDARGYSVCNTIWMLDDFTVENGATRAVPESHRWRRLPQEVLEDPRAPHPAEVLITGRAGSVVVMNAHLWHGGTANRTGAPRRALHAFYCRRDLPQQQYQKKLLSAEVQRRLSPELRKLLALDDSLNDRLSAEGAGQSGFLR
jgi:ectoine hydroxylase-related dioxygenase (phytanoyl-CoA dioxygenase family)